MRRSQKFAREIEQREKKRLTIDELKIMYGDLEDLKED